MKDYITLTFVAILALLYNYSKAFRGVGVEFECQADTECEEYSCCNVEKEFDGSYGTCEEIDEVKRCADRSRAYHISLGIILVIVVIVVITCGMLKQHEINANKKRLARLKIE